MVTNGLANARSFAFRDSFLLDSLMNSYIIGERITQEVYHGRLRNR